MKIVILLDCLDKLFREWPVRKLLSSGHIMSTLDVNPSAHMKEMLMIGFKLLLFWLEIHLMGFDRGLGCNLRSFVINLSSELPSHWL